MKNKIFEQESLSITGLETELVSLTDDDPKVDQIVLQVENDKVGKITHNPTKKKEESAPKTDPVSGITFGDSKTEVKVQKKMSELPDNIKKIQGALNDDRDVKVTSDISRWTSDDGERSGFYLSEEQVEEMNLNIADTVDHNDVSDEESSEKSEEVDENPF